MCYNGEQTRHASSPVQHFSPSVRYIHTYIHILPCMKVGGLEQIWSRATRIKLFCACFVFHPLPGDSNSGSQASITNIRNDALYVSAMAYDHLKFFFFFFKKPTQKIIKMITCFVRSIYENRCYLIIVTTNSWSDRGPFVICNVFGFFGFWIFRGVASI